MAHTLNPIDPRNGQARNPIPCTPVTDIPGLINNARAAQSAWQALGFTGRRTVIEAFVEDLSNSVDELAEMASADMGKLVEEAAGEVKGYVVAVGRMLDLMDQAISPEQLDFKGGVTIKNWLPLGVAAVITPWNFPIGMPLSLLIPALSAGNTVIYKPSEISTTTGLKVAELLNRHLPKDVLIPVTGDGEQGKAMVKGDIDLIAFVGSRDVGKSLLTAASHRAARVILEMGGKDAMVVAADADLEAAADFAFKNALRNTGQVCCSVERIYVEDKAYKTFVDKIRPLVNAVSVGTFDKASFSIGPMSSERQMKLVVNQLKDAADKGATIEGQIEPLDRDGFYLEPTLVSDVTDDMDMMNNETFGPVVCVQSVNTLEEAIAKANNTRFGLTATIWTGNEQRGRELAPLLEAGLVGVNRGFYGAAGTPWAGAKESGFGHTGGVSGMRHFLQVRSVAVSEASQEA